jgi:hypothetical protein
MVGPIFFSVALSLSCRLHIKVRLAWIYSNRDNLNIFPKNSPNKNPGVSMSTYRGAMKNQGLPQRWNNWWGI